MKLGWVVGLLCHQVVFKLATRIGICSAKCGCSRIGICSTKYGCSGIGNCSAKCGCSGIGATNGGFAAGWE